MRDTAPSQYVLTLDEACQEMHISTATAYRWLKEGKFPVKTIRVGRRLLVPRSEIERFFEAESA